MSEPKLISPMLDNFIMGDPISERTGTRCCPAMEKTSDARYIVKIISIPSTQAQLDALLLSGAYPDTESAMAYFKSVTDDILRETVLLQKLSNLDGFVPFDDCQVVRADDNTGYDVYLLSAYGTTLKKRLRTGAMTQLDALNLGLDLCSALSICRQSGYLYINLKPDNIFATTERGYRIGDLGFLKLDSLKYASLPERYRSAYTAPEIADAFSDLNTTIDVYAVGLILYQIYNDGTLPFQGETAPAEVFPAPAYADYELTEIILKACAPDPNERYQNPESLGQALVAYMQRNGAHDIPITPVAEQPEPEVDPDESVGNFETTEESESTTMESENTEETENAEPLVVTEADIFTEDSEGNLTYITNEETDETLPDEQTLDPEENPEVNVSEEVSDMLQQVDELLAHEAPAPVIQPEPIDVPVPSAEATEEAPSEENTEEQPESVAEETPAQVDVSEEVSSEEAAETPDAESTAESEVPASEDGVDSPVDSEAENTDSETDKPKKRIWLRLAIVLLILLGLAAGAYYYYGNYYLQSVDEITPLDKGDGILHVTVDSSADEEKLSVTCSDAYGNRYVSAVADGIAVFDDLLPNTAYTLEVTIDGFHKLKGTTTAKHTTPQRINISTFHATTGVNGSATLTFTADDCDAEAWTVSYLESDGSAISTDFTGRTVTLTGLKTGKTYNFVLSSSEVPYITGNYELSYTAVPFVKPEALTVLGCIDGKLTVQWNAPEGSNADSWIVRCTGDDGFDETTTVNTTSAEFPVTDITASYTVDVKAAGMSSGDLVRSPSNAVTVAHVEADASNLTQLKLTWDAYGNVPADGWTVRYTIDGTIEKETTAKENSAVLTPLVPGAQYSISIVPADGTAVMGGTLEYTVPASTQFSAYGVTADNLEFMMCRTPSWEGWDHWNLRIADYRNEFAVGENAGFVINILKRYERSSNSMVALFVVRDEDGNIIDASTSTHTWTKMWYGGYFEVNMPYTPQNPGEYTVQVYFDGMYVTEVNFTVVSE